ncbi:hypothetical protein [Streptomyces humi]|uniref:hypothetical protein n=1 Tax=Streptomyces humi TaxID=1428620 RepID=UPI0006286B31|nr:hypothetical protein [Streptomyces humi]
MHGRSGPVLLGVTYYGYYALVIALRAATAARTGRWPKAWHRYLAPHLRPRQAAPSAPLATPGEDAAGWPRLRAAGAGAAADTPRNPWAYRTADVAVGPEAVGTSVVAVGPAASM